MYSIEEIRSGKVAILNDSTIDDLNIVLKLIFPLYIYKSPGTFKYYIVDTYDVNKWTMTDVINTDMPVQSVKEFMDNPITLKYGDVIYVRNKDTDKWVEKVFISYVEDIEYPIICADKLHSKNYLNHIIFNSTNWKYWKR